jgi:hypothetical protein
MNQSLKDDMEPDDRTPLGVPKLDENPDDPIRPKKPRLSVQNRADKERRAFGAAAALGNEP